MSQTVVVFGATGFVGSAVSRSLAKHYHVRAVTRDPNSPKAQALKAEGAQLVYVDFADGRSLQEALNGAHVVFVQTNSSDGYDAEIAQGRRIADACARAAVKHAIFSSQLSVVRVNGMRARHMDAKAEVEDYMRQIGLPMTSLIIPCYYESLLIEPHLPKKTEADLYSIEIPMGTTPLNMICTEDMGEIVKNLVANPRTYTDRTVSVCGDKLTVSEITAIFNRHLGPLKFKNKQTTVEEFRRKSIPDADDLANMFDFYVRVDQRASIDLTRKLNSSAQTLDDWMATNRDLIRQAVTEGRGGDGQTGQHPAAL